MEYESLINVFYVVSCGLTNNIKKSSIWDGISEEKQNQYHSIYGLVMNGGGTKVGFNGYEMFGGVIKCGDFREYVDSVSEYVNGNYEKIVADMNSAIKNKKYLELGYLKKLSDVYTKDKQIIDSIKSNVLYSECEKFVRKLKELFPYNNDEKSNIVIKGDVNNIVIGNTNEHNVKKYEYPDEYENDYMMVAEDTELRYGKRGYLDDDLDMSDFYKDSRDSWISLKESVRRPKVGDECLVCGYCYPGCVKYCCGVYEGKDSWNTIYNNGMNPEFKVLYWKLIDKIDGIEDEM